MGLGSCLLLPSLSDDFTTCLQVGVCTQQMILDTVSASMLLFQWLVFDC